MIDRQPGPGDPRRLDRRRPGRGELRPRATACSWRSAAAATRSPASPSPTTRCSLDLSQMRAVAVDAGERTARVEPGARLADVDAATQAHGLAVPTGINSTTGIAGLTLGGGFGWISRKFGHDHRQPDLRRRRHRRRQPCAAPAPSENPDLFWAIRGGGGNFGVVDLLRVPAAPGRARGRSPASSSTRSRRRRELLRDFRRICAEPPPDELTVWAVMRKAPPLPFLPEEWHGREVLVFAACYAGERRRRREGDGASCAPSARRSPTSIGPMPFAGWQQALRPAADPGRAQLLEEPRLRRASPTRRSR